MRLFKVSPWMLGQCPICRAHALAKKVGLRDNNPALVMKSEMAQSQHEQHHHLGYYNVACGLCELLMNKIAMLYDDALTFGTETLPGGEIMRAITANIQHHQEQHGEGLYVALWPSAKVGRD